MDDETARWRRLLQQRRRSLASNRNLDRVTSLLRFNGTKDEPYKSTSRDDEFMTINTNSRRTFGHHRI